jgi:hypothetical protein
MNPITSAAAAQMTNDFSNSSSDSDIARCVTYTSAELQTIIDMAAGGIVQFQFAKNAAGQSTLVVAFSSSTDNGQATSFFNLGEICPPPEGCMLS